MKIFLTGASRGIGKALKENLVNHNVIATTRDGGYDIENCYDYVLESILKSDADVFINNAYSPKYQTRLLKDVFDAWKYLDKKIINIGSCASDMSQDNPMRNEEYPKNKIEQDDLVKQINLDYCSSGHLDGVLCKVTNVKMGYVKTDFPSLMDKRKFPNLKTEYVSSVIDWIINQPSDMCVRDISLHSTAKAEL